MIKRAVAIVGARQELHRLRIESRALDMLGANRRMPPVHAEVRTKAARCFRLASRASQTGAFRQGVYRDSVVDIELPANEIQNLFDTIPDAVFFMKDEAGCYTHCSLTLMRRLGKKHRSEVIGRTTLELFPLPFGGSYLTQDRRVLSGEVIENQLEVHLYPNRMPGWALTVKRPLIRGGKIAGVIGVSRDLGQPDSRDSSYQRLRQVIEYIQCHYDENLRVRMLAGLAGLSVAQLERHFRRVFQLTPQQLLTKLRIESAMRLLMVDTITSIASIGQACGFADQSAFSRQFKATVGITPRQYRGLKKANLSHP